MASGFIELDEAAGCFVPGSRLVGVARWTSEERVQSVAVCACWETGGKGAGDHGEGARVELERPRQTDEQRFELILSEGPYSLQGSLITINWRLELMLDDEPVAALAFVLSPFGRPVTLEKIADDEVAFQFSKPS